MKFDERIEKLKQAIDELEPIADEIAAQTIKELREENKALREINRVLSGIPFHQSLKDVVGRVEKTKFLISSIKESDDDDDVVKKTIEVNQHFTHIMDNYGVVL